MRFTLNSSKEIVIILSTEEAKKLYTILYASLDSKTIESNSTLSNFRVDIGEAMQSFLKEVS